MEFYSEIVEFLIGASLLTFLGKAILETTLGVLSIAYGLSMFVVAAVLHSKAMAEGENLRLIESAKSQFARANPGKPIGSVLAGDGTPVDLAPFLPNSKLPVSPWGVTYANVFDLANPVTSSANGDASKEPPVQPLSANGYNDVLASDRVYYTI